MYIYTSITHCSVYFLLDEPLSDVETDERSLADASVSVLDDVDVVVHSKTSDATTTTLRYVVLMLALAVATVLGASKKKSARE